MTARRVTRRALAFVALLAPALAGCYRGAINYSHTSGPRFAGIPAQAADSQALASGPGWGITGYAAPADSQIRVVTWNVKWGRQAGAAGEMLASHTRLAGADIVLLQEMTEQSVAVIASRLGFGYVYYPATVHPREQQHMGNAILSPWPITEDRKLVLPHRARFMGTERIAVRATVTVEGRRLRVYSLHLATPFEVGEGGIEDQLEAVIADAEDSADPILVGGDFNSSRVGGLLVEAGYHWLTRGIGPTIWTLRLDHLFVRGVDLHMTAGVVAAEPLPSDHRPVWAVLQP